MRSAMLDHGVASPRAELHRLCVAALAGVGLGADVLRRYPHELSGGMKQRVCIAIGMLLGPKVIIADEPTSALDVVSQRLVMETLGREQQRSNAALAADRPRHRTDGAIRPSACGHVRRRLVEIGTIREVLTRPAPSLHARADRQHPQAARPRRCSAASRASRLRCASCRQAVHSIRAVPARFERCLHRRARCSTTIGDHHAACHLQRSRHDCAAASNSRLPASASAR